jgi:hypothetical protein
MLRERTFWLLIALFALSSLACNAFAGGTEPIAPPPPPITTTPGVVVVDGTVVGEATGLAATVTPEGGAAGTATNNPTATPSTPTVIVLVDLNVRAGPGTQYERVSFLLADENAAIIGRDSVSSWWKIECPARTPVNGVQCWVSGGDNFSQAINTSGVPVAEVPPTPTPIPPEPQPGQGMVVFVENGRLHTANLDLSQNPATINDPVAISPTDVVVQKAIIAPDGRRIAYLVNLNNFNELRIMNLDGSGQVTLLNSDDLPVASDNGAVSTLIDQVEWLPNAQGLLFNTSQATTGAGFIIPQVDLWSVTLAGDVAELFGAGTGAGWFSITANNQVIMSQAEAIYRANLDGSNRQRLIAFDFINTASEYTYYPAVQPADDGLTYVAIPGPDPFFGDEFTELWRFASNGVGEQHGRLPDNTLFSQVYWSNDGDRLGYVAFSGDTVSSLMLAGGSGRESTPYLRDEQLQMWPWSPDSQYFLYSTLTDYGVGRVNEVPVEVGIVGNGRVTHAEWLSNSQFLIVTRLDNGWRLDSGNIEGAHQELLTINSNFDIILDVWTP